MEKGDVIVMTAAEATDPNSRKMRELRCREDSRGLEIQRARINKRFDSVVLAVVAFLVLFGSRYVMQDDQIFVARVYQVFSIVAFAFGCIRFNQMLYERRVWLTMRSCFHTSWGFDPYNKEPK